MKRINIVCLIALLLAFGLAQSPASADTSSDVGFRGWGPRLGLSDDPDQVHFGAHLDFGNFSQHVRFQPNVELGLSDNLSLLALNAEAAYRFSSHWDAWTPYLGGGLGLNVRNWDNDGRGDDSDSDVGVNALGGIDKGLSNGDRFFIELKVSLNDVPDLKATIGWTFYH